MILCHKRIGSMIKYTIALPLLISMLLNDGLLLPLISFYKFRQGQDWPGDWQHQLCLSDEYL